MARLLITLTAIFLAFVSTAHSTTMDDSGFTGNPACGLIVPPNPLTAAGLSTPYQLVPLDPTQGTCSMSTTVQQAFVNAIILDLNTGSLSSYNPLVIDNGTSPAIPPVVPTLPANNLVALFFGSNSQAYGTAVDTLTLLPWNSTVNSLVQGNCLQGSLTGNLPDYFGQFSFCNSPQFFDMAHSLIASGKIVVPPLKIAKDGYVCPTSRSFDLVDDNQSDTLITSYLLTPEGTVAQYNTANRGALLGAILIDNLSDELLLVNMSIPLGCTPWQIPDLTNGNVLVSNFATDELQAAYHQPYPMAQVPALDNNVISTIYGTVDLMKLNAYRLGVGQTLISDIENASLPFYCQAMASVGSHRFSSAKPYWSGQPSPDPTMGIDLYTFLAARYIETFTSALGDNGLNCTGVLNIPCPLKGTFDANGVCTAVTVDVIDPLKLYVKSSHSSSPATTSGATQATLLGLAIGLIVVLWA